MNWKPTPTQTRALQRSEFSPRKYSCVHRSQGSVYTCECVLCGALFSTYKSRCELGRGKFCSKTCSRVNDAHTLTTTGTGTRFLKGLKPWNAQGFRYTNSRKGGGIYKLLHIPNHPMASKTGYVREHRFIIEQKIGRYLHKEEVVHHINGDTLDNRVENLELMNHQEHRRLHLKDTLHKRWLTRNTTV